MTFLNKTIALASATLITAGSAAFAESHASIMDFDAEAARLDVSLDMDGDGEVSDEEIIRGNMAVFDLDGSGTIDAEEQAIAENALGDNDM